MESKDQTQQKTSNKSAAALIAGLVGGAVFGWFIHPSAEDPEAVETEVVHEVEVEAETAPSDCLKALESSRDVINLASESIEYSQEALEAYYVDDIDTIDDAAAGLEDVNMDLEGVYEDYVLYEAKCRGN